MSFAFPKTDQRKLGYKPEQVDEFIALARSQFNNPNAGLVSANDVRNKEFDFIRGGYASGVIDDLMGKFEDIFSSREIVSNKAQYGSYALEDQLYKLNELIRGRIQRPKRKRFASTSFLLRGYSRKEVDLLCARIESHLVSVKGITVDEIRLIAFNAKRGGYVEAQVDAFINRVSEILQIENTLDRLIV